MRRNRVCLGFLGAMFALGAARGQAPPGFQVTVSLSSDSIAPGETLVATARATSGYTVVEYADSVQFMLVTPTGTLLYYYPDALPPDWIHSKSLVPGRTVTETVTFDGKVPLDRRKPDRKYLPRGVYTVRASLAAMVAPDAGVVKGADASFHWLGSEPDSSRDR